MCDLQDPRLYPPRPRFLITVSVGSMPANDMTREQWVALPARLASRERPGRRREPTGA